MATCKAGGSFITCSGGCGCLVVAEPEEGDVDAYCMCGSKPKIELRTRAGKTVEMTLEDFTANYAPKNKLSPETKVSFTCGNLHSSVLAGVLQKSSPNKITVSERIANTKLNFTLSNTTLAEVIKSSGFASTG